MKNIIRYYYGINIEEYKEKNEEIIFTSNGITYEFVICDGNINLLMEVYTILVAYHVYCHEIIVNKNNTILTNYNNKNYVLIKKHIDNNDTVNLNNIYNYDISVKTNQKLNWKVLWEKKLDYYEYQISELGLKYNKLRESFRYYSGLCECAISLLNYVDYNNIRMGISHKRVNNDETINEFTNPLNIIIDNITRDLASYIQSSVMHGKTDVNEVTDFIKNINLTSDEYILFMSRLIYPSYYFDIYDSIIQEKLDENAVDEVIKKNSSYELFLRKIYLFIKNKSNIPYIEWLHNSNYF